MAQIPDFTDTELWVLRSALKERDGRDVGNQFFYAPAEQFSTSRREFAKMGGCATPVLRVQADDECDRAGASPAGPE